jgi:hypothetical protein
MPLKTIRNQTHDLPTFSAEHQPTASPRDPRNIRTSHKKKIFQLLQKLKYRSHTGGYSRDECGPRFVCQDTPAAKSGGLHPPPANYSPYQWHRMLYYVKQEVAESWLRRGRFVFSTQHTVRSNQAPFAWLFRLLTRMETVIGATLVTMSVSRSQRIASRCRPTFWRYLLVWDRLLVVLTEGHEAALGSSPDTCREQQKYTTLHHVNLLNPSTLNDL